MSPCFFERKNHHNIWLWNILWNGFIIIIYINNIEKSCNCLCDVNFTIQVIINCFNNRCVFGFIFIFLLRLDTVKEIVWMSRLVDLPVSFYSIELDECAISMFDLFMMHNDCQLVSSGDIFDFLTDCCTIFKMLAWKGVRILAPYML